MHTVGIYDCIACRKELVDNKTAEKRVERARLMLEKYPNWDDWKRVWFNGDVYFGWSDEGRLHIKMRDLLTNCLYSEVCLSWTLYANGFEYNS